MQTLFRLQSVIRPFQLVFLFLILALMRVGGILGTLKPITSTQNTTVHQRNTQQPSETPTKGTERIIKRTEAYKYDRRLSYSLG